MLAESKPTSRQWLSLVILSLSLGIIILDASVVNVTLPAIRKEFNATLVDLEWISATYAVVYGSFIITWGRLGDMLGRRRIFMAGIATFIIGSSMVGFANSIGMIILGRAVQGMGAAMSSPATLSILSATFTGKGTRCRVWRVGSDRGYRWCTWSFAGRLVYYQCDLAVGVLDKYSDWNHCDYRQPFVCR